MNIDNIRQLAEILTSSGLSCIEVTENDVRVRLEREVTAVQPSGNQPLQQLSPVLQISPSQIETESDQVIDFNKVREIKSPMVGLFYPSATPGKPPFVSKGDKIQKGDILCIIEAMKMMNEIIAEEDGVLLDICAQEGQLVEFSQVLFKII